jgi:hypothetical protein
MPDDQLEIGGGGTGLGNLTSQAQQDLAANGEAQVFVSDERAAEFEKDKLRHGAVFPSLGIVVDADTGLGAATRGGRQDEALTSLDGTL